MNCQELETLLHPYLDGETHAGPACGRGQAPGRLRGLPPQTLADCRPCSAPCSLRPCAMPPARPCASACTDAIARSGCPRARPEWPRGPPLQPLPWSRCPGLDSIFLPHGRDEDDAMVDAAVDAAGARREAKHISRTSPPATRAIIEVWFSDQLALRTAGAGSRRPGLCPHGRARGHGQGQTRRGSHLPARPDLITVFVCPAAEAG